ncbi:MAG: hypothetical protein HXX14_10040 [Bacteroidetes bacterium]|nr:hypothetical protein [Bacteroidota bacterium]
MNRSKSQHTTVNKEYPSSHPANGSELKSQHTTVNNHIINLFKTHP